MHRKAVIVLSLILCFGGVAVLMLISQVSDSTTIACLSTVETDMTPQEFSQNLNIPLVTFVSPPEFIINDPTVELYVWHPIETPACGLRINYFTDDDTTHPIIEIIVRNTRSTETIRTDWSCFNYEFESMSNTDLQSVCSKLFTQSGRQVFVSVSTIYSVSETSILVNEFDLDIEFFD